MSHTKGKWESDELSPEFIVCGNKIIASIASPNDVLCYEDKDFKGTKASEATANARRICQCVNGWDNLQALNKQLLDAYRKIGKKADTIVRQSKDGKLTKERMALNEIAIMADFVIEAAERKQ